METNDLQISLYLDTRRVKKGGLYPLKIRAWNPRGQKQIFFPTGKDLKEAEYQGAYLYQQIDPKRKRAKPEYRNLETELLEIESKARGAAAECATFEDLARKLKRKRGDDTDVFSHYSERIKSLRANDQPGTETVYNNAKLSFSAYLKERRGREVSKLSFYDVTPAFLNDYERYMTAEGKSMTTVSMYVRTLRTLFHDAVTAGDIEGETLPFGRGRYVIPNTRNTKKALKPDQLGTLMQAKGITPDQVKARDFWFFSYACNGMNMRDILSLRWENIKGDRIEYIRAKTKNTKREHLTPVTVQLNDFARSVIIKYGTDPTPPAYIFPILTGAHTAKEQYNRVKIFTRFVNQHIKKLATALGLPPEISTYWARHSFATNVIRQGFGIELLSESLNHGDIKTTQRYIAGFDEDVKRELSIKIMDFS